MSQEKITFSITKRALFGTTCMIFGALIGTATIAFADGDFSTQTVVGSELILPYEGFLMIDSSPVTGTRTIKFDLYQNASGGTSVWDETLTVDIYNGRFSVGLGSGTSLTSTLLDAEKLYLAMTIIETDSQGNTLEIGLSGRQAIEPAPFAAWSANSADFNVAGILDVEKSATIGTDLTVGSDLYVKGDEIKLGTNNANALYQNGSDQLYISPSKSFTGGVYVGNDFNTNYNTRLGPTSGSYSTTVYGPDNDGSSAALQIAKSNGSTMYLDDNEIDTNNTLHLQYNSNNSIGLNGTTYLYKNAMYLQDSTSTNYTLTGVDSSHDESGVELRTQSNPSSGEALFRVLSESGSERLRVEHDGTTYTSNNLESEGDTTVGGDLNVNGNFSNFGLELTSVTASGNNGSGYVQLTTTGLDSSGNGSRTSICFLMDVKFDDLDSDEYHHCYINQANSGGVKYWYLGAQIDGGGGQIDCQAGCFSWNN